MRLITILLILIIANSSAYVINDPTGDTVIQTVGGDYQHGAAQIDIVKAWIIEGESNLLFGVKFQGSNETLQRSIEIQFDVGPNEFLLAHADTCDSMGLHERRSRVLDACVKLIDNPANQSAEITVAKNSFGSRLGHSLGPGDTLENIRFIGSATTLVGFYEYDEATSGIPFFPVLSKKTDNPFLLFTETPYHYSNGEAGAFVYNITLRNNGNADTLLLNYSQVPEGWIVSAPNAINVEENSHKNFFVIITIPSRHTHGETQGLKLAASNSESSTDIQIGLTFPIIPNPAGHHNTLYFHGDPPGQSIGGTILQLWMNTSPDSEYTDAPYPSYMAGTDETIMNGWFAQMLPRLQMGLDFIEGSQAWLNGSLEFEVPSQSIEAQAVLWLDAKTDLLIGESQWIPLVSGNSVNFVIPLDILDGIDVIPFEERSNLQLELIIKHIGAPTAEQIEWNLVSSELHLPLTDYRPVIPQLPFTDIFVDGLPSEEVKLNAGKTRLLTGTIEGSEQAYSVAVEGYNSAWFTHEALVNAGDQMHLVIAPPESARPGDYFEVIIRVEGETGFWLQPMYGQVVAELIDSETWEFEEKETPAISLLMVGVIVAVLARRRLAS
jgi:hypothetical protein